MLLNLSIKLIRGQFCHEIATHCSIGKINGGALAIMHDIQDPKMFRAGYRYCKNHVESKAMVIKQAQKNAISHDEIYCIQYTPFILVSSHI